MRASRADQSPEQFTAEMPPFSRTENLTSRVWVFPSLLSVWNVAPPNSLCRSDCATADAPLLRQLNLKLTLTVSQRIDG